MTDILRSKNSNLSNGHDLPGFLDSHPSWLVKTAPDETVIWVHSVILGSLLEGVFPATLKKAVTHPSAQEAFSGSNYTAQFSSSLPFLGKIIEKVVGL